MPERLTPGVYVDEVAGASRPIQGVGTATAAFIGEAPRGVPDRAEFVTGFLDFERRFGGHRRGEDGFLAQAVEAFFGSGGRRAFVVRVLPADATAGASPDVAGRAPDAWNLTRQVLRFEARGNGAWADHLRVHIEPATAFAERTFRIRVEWVEAGRSRTLETFDAISLDPESEDYAPRVLEDSSQYLLLTDLFAAALDADARTLPPLPEQLPALVTREPAGDAYELPVGARLQFSWRDLSSGLGTDATSPPTVTLDEDAVADADGTVGSGLATLTAAQLAGLLGDGLGDDFRVTESGDAVRVEPAVAARAYVLLRLPDDAQSFDLSGLSALAVRVADADDTDASAQTVEIDLSDPDTDEVSPGELAGLVTAAAAAGPNPFGLTAEAAGPFVVLTAGPSGDGTRITVTATGGAAPWPAPQAVGGAPGLEVDALNGIELTVAEVIRPGVGRALSTLFATVRATGRTENDPADPGLRPAETGDTPLRVVGGTDGTGPVPVSQYVGAVTERGRSGLRAFDTADINMLVLPGKTTSDFLSAAMAYCDANDVFLVADGVGSTDLDFEITADEVGQLVEGLPARSVNAALFYPWLQVPDPTAPGRAPRRLVPPSGHVAGVFARTDTTRGVWKAPAGIEARVSGVVDLQHRLTDADQDRLNPIGVNCIRQFPNTGVVSWGSRTLAADPQWRYVPVRRTALFLKESLRRGLQWAVFEPNDPELWDRIRIAITAFMLGLFRQGAFQGSSPEEAFLVKCDRETNPQELVDQGIVTAQVAFAPLKPAEFVVIEISQKSLLAV